MSISFHRGETASIEAMIREGNHPHRVAPGDHGNVAEYGPPPPRCGTRVHQAFSRFISEKLKMPLGACDSSEASVRCSTDYFPPRHDKEFWRLMYAHGGDSLEFTLDAFKRDGSGRAGKITASRTEEFNELFEFLLRVVRCE